MSLVRTSWSSAGVIALAAFVARCGGTDSSSEVQDASLAGSVDAAGDHVPTGLSSVESGNCLGTIVASNYDQSCSVDSDCVAVEVGDVCPGICSFFCGRPNSAIAAGAYPQYMADLARTVGSMQFGCGCPVTLIPAPVPCCVSGKCQSIDQCELLDAGDASRSSP